jgi:Putative peptidoglycan binding domain
MGTFKNKFFIVGVLIICGLFWFSTMSFAANGMIDAASRYSWSENAGWLDFGTSQGNVVVGDSELTGYAWGENIGWVSLNCSNDNSCAAVNYKVTNDGSGNLSGYAYTENAGWIDFDPAGGGVSIDSLGNFSGYAWGENIGWIVFNCATTNSCSTVNYKVATDWRPASASVQTLPTAQTSVPGQPRMVLPKTAPVATQLTRTEILAKIAQIQTLIADLQKQLAAMTGSPSSATTANQSSIYSCAQITKDLYYGMENDSQVKCLQEFLIAQGYSIGSATGNYFSLTQAAVSRFQEKYADEILLPSGFKVGTGMVGEKTRQVINKLLAGQ